MNIPGITTERLVLRAFCEQDVDPLFDILQQPEILRYYPRTDPPPRDAVERFVARQLTHWRSTATAGGRSKCAMIHACSAGQA